MSSEGVTLVSRVALVLVLIIVTSFFRVLIGSGPRRDLYVLGGTLGGISLGVATATLVSRWVKMDVSTIGACLGIFAGWTVAWVFARRLPREAD
jgi:hypothetical protein